jgi:alpha-glucosidase (family GH31 glycosyl hydrolase)
MQFPKDTESAEARDEFMLGDELLVAPIYDGHSSRSLYLPMGIWTRLSDNRVFPGKHVITIEGKSGELVLFSRNGSILPLGSEPMKLHYFPRLGGEFFVFETELQDYSQIHAAPAGDFMRLEIESRKDRRYEWILHHVDRPRTVVGGEVRGWFYDSPNGNLHVSMLGRAGQDDIVTISF